MTKKTHAKEPEFIPCTARLLPAAEQVAAAQTAVAANPANAPLLSGLMDVALGPQHLAVLVSRYWGPAGVRLSVGFLDNAPADLRARILSHMNAWSAYAKVSFAETASPGSAQVRIARAADGYWSYLGTDVLHIPQGQPTMNLQGFTMATPESEYRRVVRHETGHTLGFPHEHLRRELVQRLDRQKTIAYFQQMDGWSPQMTTQQVLTPVEESSLRGTPHADQDSIMAYSLPASITTDGQPIRGGNDIDPTDAAFVATLYPLPTPPDPPPPPPPPPGTVTRIVIEVDGTVRSARVVPG